MSGWLVMALVPVNWNKKNLQTFQNLAAKK